jgi:hypothetical protein
MTFLAPYLGLLNLKWNWLNLMNRPVKTMSLLLILLCPVCMHLSVQGGSF